MRKSALILLLAFLAGLGMVFVSSSKLKESNTVTHNAKMREYEDPNTTEGTLEIDNVQKDNSKNKYTYSVKINSVSGAIKYTINDTENYKVFNARGEASFEINANDKLVIYNIPVGVSYTVTQTAKEGYKTTISNTVSNTTTGTTKAREIITFTNTSNAVNTNPNTLDNIWLYGILFVAVGAAILILTRIKTPKYTTE